ncbi:zinc finger and SCAN domain-containing protein 23 [Trichonephila clavipes]|nr:zinc finger and SCAN domain-containing protein 23 [Trichonephila clavipes]
MMEAYLINSRNPVFHNEFMQIIESEDLFSLLQTNASENSQTEFQPPENVALFGPSTALQYKPQMEGNVMKSRMYKVSGHETSSYWQNHIQANQPNSFLLQTYTSENSQTEIQPTENVALFGPSTALQYEPQMEGNVMESQMYKVSRHETSSNWQNRIQADHPNSFFECNYSNGVNSELRQGREQEIPLDISFDSRRIATTSENILGQEGPLNKIFFSQIIDTHLLEIPPSDFNFLDFQEEMSDLNYEVLATNFGNTIENFERHMLEHSASTIQRAASKHRFSAKEYFSPQMCTHTEKKTYQCDGSSESVQEFATRINKLGTQIFQSNNSVLTTAARNANDQLLQSRFISDLKNDIRRFVLARDPNTLEESINAALIEEQNLKLNEIACNERSGLSSLPTESPVISSLTDKLQELNLRVERLQEASTVIARETSKGEFHRKINVFKCFYCGLEGL